MGLVIRRLHNGGSIRPSAAGAIRSVVRFRNGRCHGISHRTYRNSMIVLQGASKGLLRIGTVCGMIGNLRVVSSSKYSYSICHGSVGQAPRAMSICRLVGPGPLAPGRRHTTVVRGTGGFIRRGLGLLVDCSFMIIGGKAGLCSHRHCRSVGLAAAGYTPGSIFGRRVKGTVTLKQTLNLSIDRFRRTIRPAMTVNRLLTHVCGGRSRAH